MCLSIEMLQVRRLFFVKKYNKNFDINLLNRSGLFQKNISRITTQNISQRFFLVRNLKSRFLYAARRRLRFFFFNNLFFKNCVLLFATNSAQEWNTFRTFLLWRHFVRYYHFLCFQWLLFHRICLLKTRYLLAFGDFLSIECGVGLMRVLTVEHSNSSTIVSQKNLCQQAIVFSGLGKLVCSRKATGILQPFSSVVLTCLNQLRDL